MLDKAFELLQTYEFGDDRKALNPIDEAIIKTHGDAAGRKELEDRMIAVVKSDATRNGKDYVCRQLKVIGTEASVPVLAEMLSDENHSHMARYALESMPNDAAGAALRAALGKLSGDLKIGVIGSLGVRRDDACVPELQKLVGDSDAAIATSAARALAAIRTPAAAKALMAAAPNEAAAAATTDAMLATAEQLLAGGDKNGALVIYTKLTKSPLNHVKLAATNGMLACAGAVK
ncbi:MAG: hypothetical protein KDB27_21440 [Planctomycetales bacterium]|nr:hypothetical protein [Planctomycetales bacterium]